MAIEKGKHVLFDYTLTVDGKKIDSSDNNGPLKYVHGEGDIIPGLERQLEGLDAGVEKKIEVIASEGYGEKDVDAFYEIKKTKLPSNIEPKAGMTLEVKNEDGSFIPVKISEVKEEAVVIDLNHPLAGKTLQFEIKIISVE